VGCNGLSKNGAEVVREAVKSYTRYTCSHGLWKKSCFTWSCFGWFQPGFPAQCGRQKMHTKLGGLGLGKFISFLCRARVRGWAGLIVTHGHGQIFVIHDSHLTCVSHTVCIFAYCMYVFIRTHTCIIYVVY